MVTCWRAVVPQGHVHIAYTIRSRRTPKVFAPAANADIAVAARRSNLTLQDVRVVLTSPKSPGNIGSAARAAENFEVSDLWVVDPRCDPRDGEAHMLACGSPLMDTMTIVPTLQEALAHTSASIGFTRRPVQPSLNLSHAACVVLAQLFEQRTSNHDADVAAVKQVPKQHQPAPRSDVESLINRWTELTDAAGLGLADSVGGTGSHGRKRRTAGHVKAVLSRAQVTVQELRVLHGLCSALLERVQQADL
ncbi:hypothetical protein WJX82_008393 [Trebouxia sp. C0006]